MLALPGVGFALSQTSEGGAMANALVASSAGSFAALLASASSALHGAQQEAAAVASPPALGSSGISPAESAKLDFRNWKAEYFQRGISEDRRQEVEQFSADFEQLIDKAVAQNAYADPQAFLQSLSASELNALQKIHGLAESISPTGLSEEGALNLLLSPGNTRDIDHDGFQMVGLAKTWKFPPANAPQSVKQAWKTASQDLSESDAMLLEGSFLPLVADGITGQSAFIGPDADYREIVQQAIDAAEFGKSFDQSWQQETRDRQLEVLTDLLGKL